MYLKIKNLYGLFTNECHRRKVSLILALLFISYLSLFPLRANAICSYGFNYNHIGCDTEEEALDYLNSFPSYYGICNITIQPPVDNCLTLAGYVWFGQCDSNGIPYFGSYVGFCKSYDPCFNNPDPCCASKDPCCGNCDKCCEQTKGGNGSGPPEPGGGG